jgi:hypothetical protein
MRWKVDNEGILIIDYKITMLLNPSQKNQLARIIEER